MNKNQMRELMLTKINEAHKDHRVVSVAVSGIDSTGYPKSLIKLMAEVWPEDVPVKIILIEGNADRDPVGDPLDIIERAKSKSIITSHLGFLEDDYDHFENVETLSMSDLVRRVHAGAIGIESYISAGESHEAIRADIGLALVRTKLESGFYEILGTDPMSYDVIRASDVTFVEYFESPDYKIFPDHKPPRTIVEPMWVQADMVSDFKSPEKTNWV